MKAKIIIDKDFIVGKTDEKLFGSFVEPIGRCIYGGIFEPGHPKADAQGFREDVLEFTRPVEPVYQPISRRKLYLHLSLGGYRRPAFAAPAPRGTRLAMH